MGEKLLAYKMQFPWRLLMVIFFLLAFTVAYFLICINKKRVLILASTIMIVTASIPTITIYGSAVLLMIQGKEQEERGFLREYDPNYADKLYLPEGAVLKKVRKNKGKVSANHNILFETSRDTGKILVSVKENNYDDTIVHIPFLYYKGYTAKNQTTEKQYYVEKDSYGHLCINIGKDTGKILIFYKGTRLQEIANNISIITCIFFLGILGYSLWKKDRRKK